MKKKIIYRYVNLKKLVKICYMIWNNFIKFLKNYRMCANTRKKDLKEKAKPIENIKEKN